MFCILVPGEPILVLTSLDNLTFLILITFMFNVQAVTQMVLPSPVMGQGSFISTLNKHP